MQIVLAAFSMGVPIAILITALAILAAVKSGFNEVIKGLEAIADRLDRAR